MRGNEKKRIDAFCYVSMEDWIPTQHPLRKMRTMVDEMLSSLDSKFDTLYAVSGQPSIAPEYLL